MCTGEGEEGTETRTSVICLPQVTQSSFKPGLTGQCILTNEWSSRALPKFLRTQATHLHQILQNQTLCMHIRTSSPRARVLDESPEMLAVGAEYYHLNYYFPATLKLFPNHFTRQMPIAQVAPEDMVFGSRRQSGPWPAGWLPLLCSGMNLAGNMPLKLSFSSRLSWQEKNVETDVIIFTWETSPVTFSLFFLLIITFV